MSCGNLSKKGLHISDPVQNTLRFLKRPLRNRIFISIFLKAAVPKDGPSAGITVAIAILSAITGKKVRKDVAMTGEITLRGHVLPIGGLKEKSLAAYRNGIVDIIMPDENEKDLADVPAEIREKVRWHQVNDFTQVLDLALKKDTETGQDTITPTTDDATIQTADEIGQT